MSQPLERPRRARLLWRAIHRASSRVDAAYQVFDVLRSELLVAAVAPGQWPEFTRASYDDNQLFRSDAHNSTLRDWELRSIERFFPPAPARVLVGGAGGGREVRGLLSLGYQVAAFDPAEDLVRHARRTLSCADLLAYSAGGYEELVHDELDLTRSSPFDAVVLGWGSFSHVGDPDIRRRLPGVLRQICPAGPVLMSWIAAKPAGRWRGTLRSALELVGLPRNDGSASYRPHMGFVHSPSSGDVRDLAAGAAYDVAQIDPDVPYAVWVPRGGGAGGRS